MAGPIKISVLADVGKAVKDVTHFSDVVDSETKRVVTSLGDSKLHGGFGKVQEGFDVLDTRAMGFRDTITGVQDSMTGWQIVSGQTAKAVENQQKKVDAAQQTYDKLKAKVDAAKSSQEGLTATARSQIAAVQQQIAAIRAHTATTAAGKQAQKDEILTLQQKIASIRDDAAAHTTTSASNIKALQDQATAAKAALGQETSSLNTAKSANKSFADGLFQLGAGVGDLASGMANFIVPLLAMGTGIKTLGVATKIQTAYQWALNVAMSANPVALVVLAIVALIAAVVVAYKKSATFRAIVQALGAAFMAAIGAVGRFVSGALQYLSSLPGKIGGIFGRARDLLVNVGRDIIDGLRRGIEGAWHWVQDKLNSLVSAIPGPVRKLLGIGSPSKVFAEIGKFVGQGFALGITSTGRLVRKATQGLVSIPSTVTAPIARVGGARALGQGVNNLAPVAPPPVTLELRPDGTKAASALLEVLRTSVRAKGGNVQVVMGS